MIRIGLTKEQKEQEIIRYLNNKDISKIYCFFFKKFYTEYNIENTNIEYIEYSDIEKYKYFYRLLEEITEDSLIIIDECMRASNRNKLTYNCAHHYLNQSPHRIIFEYFPIIENYEDFMILLNFENKGKYKGKSFEFNHLKMEDIKMIKRTIPMKIKNIRTTRFMRERYEREKNLLFKLLGNQDPDTIPRNLHLLTGDFKKEHIKEKTAVARNNRFRFKNVVSYTDINKISEEAEILVVDFHYRRLNFNDFLKTMKSIKEFEFLSTSLPVDKFYAKSYLEWKERCEAIYDKADVYQ